jgi:transcriptional regulator with XRE-family HTH domain
MWLPMHRELARWLKDPEGLGAQLKAARIQAGITHVGLVDATGMTRQRISAAENGKQLPTPEEVESWARACQSKAADRRQLVALAREGAEIRQYWRIRDSGGQRANQAGWTALYRSVDQV